MNEPPEIPESTLWDLDNAFNAMEDEVALNQRVFEATEKSLGEIARRFCPGIGSWEPEQLKRLADVLSRAAHRYCLELSDLDAASWKAQEEKG